MDPAYEIVSHKLRLVTSIQEFRYTDGPEKGKRILWKPYWVKLKDAWSFDFIKPDTDPGILAHNIKAGAVYVLDEVRSQNNM